MLCAFNQRTLTYTQFLTSSIDLLFNGDVSAVMIANGNEACHNTKFYPALSIGKLFSD